MVLVFFDNWGVLDIGIWVVDESGGVWELFVIDWCFFVLRVGLCWSEFFFDISIVNFKVIYYWLVLKGFLIFGFVLWVLFEMEGVWWEWLLWYSILRMFFDNKIRFLMMFWVLLRFIVNRWRILVKCWVGFFRNCMIYNM